MRKPTKLTPIHPGEILLEEFMQPLGITANRLAMELRITPARIGEIVHGKRAITANTALRLARFFGTSAQFWMNLQAHYDLDVATDAAEAEIKVNVRPYKELAHA